MHQFHLHLRELRKKKGLSIRALSEKMDISHNTLAAYERSQMIPTITNAVKICNYFKVPIEYLLYGDKVLSKFQDLTLLRLFKEIDTYSEEDKDIAKRLLKKLVKINKAKKQLITEIDKIEVDDNTTTDLDNDLLPFDLYNRPQC